jgi:SNF2 family DNA or RNA helicase
VALSTAEMEAILKPLIPEGVMYETQKWQARDLNYLGPMPASANWSQMGTYKTSTGLWLLQRKQIRNAIIITSKVGKGAYFSDFYRCLPKNWRLFNVELHKATQRIEGFEKPIEIDALLKLVASGTSKSPIVLLMHYDCFTDAAKKSTAKKDPKGLSLLHKLMKIEFDFILADEAHKLKNRDAQWTKNIKKLKARNRHIMTGTGFVNNPAEMWSLLNFIDPKEFKNYWEFRTHFCDEVIDARGWRVIIGIRSYRVEEFRNLRKKMGPRRTMSEVHASIAQPIEIVREVELNTTQRRMYNEIKNTLQTMDEAGEPLMSPNVLSMLNRLRQICVATPKVNAFDWSSKANRMVYDIELTEKSSKLDDVMSILEEIDDEKVVVFSNFRGPLDLLEKRLEKKGISHLHMKQQHSDAQRYKMWHDQFWAEDGPQVFLSTLALGGESINLACAKYLIFLDRSWSPKDMLQAIGRVHRPGQTGVAEIIYINAKNTVDSYVKSRLDTKGKWFAQIFDEGKGT